MNSRHFPQHESRPDEIWVRGRNTANPVSVRKAAVRVRKGATGGNRPGTFQGATNFRGSERQV